MPDHPDHQSRRNPSSDNGSSSQVASKRHSRGNRNQPIVSCLECRRMKWKCDRTFPCANCTKRGLEELCPYGRLTSAKDNRELVNSLQQKVNQLEAALEEVQKRLAVSTETQPSSSADLISVTRPSSREALDNEIANDHGQLTLGDGPGASRYFGGAGAAYLVGDDNAELPQVQSTKPLIGDPLNNAEDIFPIFEGSPNPAYNLETVRSYLPTLAEAQRLTRIYFEDASFINHILERDSFDDEFLQHVYQPGGRIDNHRLAVVFLVLAIGVQMDLNLPPYDSLGENYFRLARTSLSFDTSSSVAFVQAVHLMSRYHVNSRGGVMSSSGFWSILGFAVRCSQQLGLHRDGKKWGLEMPETELRRRIFWEIHTEDILQSMTQGRPRLVLTEHTYDVELPTLRSPADPSLLFHHYKYRLAKLLTRVNDLQISVMRPAYKDILRVDQALRQFELELPDSLRFDESRLGVGTRTESLQRVVMMVMITEGFLFLHRSHFARALASNPNEPLESHFRFSYVSVLESSRVMVHLLQCALQLHESLASRFWIFFFHAFSAIVNFACTVVRSPASSLARAAYAQMQVGVGLFQRIDPIYTPRNDLPGLQRLLERATLALITSRAPSPDRTEDLLGASTTLRRVPAPKRPVTSLASSRNDVTSLVLPVTTPALPTTLEDAVAVQNEFLAEPWNPVEWTTPMPNEMNSAEPGPPGDELMSWTAGLDPSTFGDEFFNLDNFLM
ncbi:fungal-specific transcription factor domain-domain-containing protein [Naematelia encephala]|uniref:Fungal-specific transcription factor domain-domain-containing protein n=1 Tax=Naematelia encephala TaxID=71784 RepID=A0A1Y2B675_9TREE|nr:fungal-specific transcription factor domain-domain-containing protein [Naematelia encephala]